MFCCLDVLIDDVGIVRLLLLRYMCVVLNVVYDLCFVYVCTRCMYSTWCVNVVHVFNIYI